MDVTAIIDNQRKYFSTGATLSAAHRIEYLRRVQNWIRKNETKIAAALYGDLGKSETEAYMSEIGIVLGEIAVQLAHVKKWSKPQKVATPMMLYKGKSTVVSSPYGVTLIMSPWNYPFQLTLNPLVEAIAAGNTAVVKPSAYAPATGELIAKLVAECFDPSVAAVVLGGREANATLLDQEFDYIFFTGGKTVGRLVLEKAAVHLTPVTLELGGKSPCIVDASADLKRAAKRIVFGKFLNCGQTCVAPDYLLAESSIKNRLIELIRSEIAAQYGAHPLDNPDYGKIVNDKHFRRILGLIESDRVLIGGAARDGRIEPTVTDADENSPLMQEEIFGPVLPVLTYSTRDGAAAVIARHPTPLALYLFSSDRSARDYFLNRVQFGGGCVNDTVVHLTSTKMGFGGVGKSGMGAYHGKVGFETFTHKKSVFTRSDAFDPSARFAPYDKKKLRFLKKFIK